MSTAETLALRALLASQLDEFQTLLEKYAARNPRLFGSVARGTARSGSDIDILIEMDPADGNLLMRASGLMEEARALFGRDDIDIFPAQLLKRPVSESALADAVDLVCVERSKQRAARLGVSPARSSRRVRHAHDR